MDYESTTFDPEMEAAPSRTAEALQRAQRRTRETAEDTVDLIRRNPGLTLVVSFLSGAALGALILSNILESRRPTRWERFSSSTAEAWDRVRSLAEQAAAQLKESISR